MRLKIGILALVLLAGLALAATAGILPSGVSTLAGLTSVEASDDKWKAQSNESTVNQQAISRAIAVHGADKWHEAGFTGAGVKIGVIDFGFGGFEEYIGTEAPDPVGVRCYSFNLDPTAPPSYSTDIADCDHTNLHFSRLHGASVLEAVYDIAPDAEYYIAAVSHFSFYHTDLNDAVNWMIDEDVDIITFSHVGAWSGPGDGTSPYPTSEINILNRAVDSGITWISPAGDRARDTWSGFFTDADGNDIHEFSDGIECNDVDLSETDHPYRVQLRWNDTWGSAERDLELSLVDKSSGQIVATSQKAHFAPHDPNELLDFTTPDRQASYCLRLALATPTDSRIVVNVQSYGRHGLSYPSLYGSITSPGESANDGALTVGAAPVGNAGQIQPFSGRGPMNSRNIKPDLVGADDTQSLILGRPWESTSLAAAHITGLAALVKQRFPNYTPAMIADYLRDNAESRPVTDPFLGPDSDPNNTWGHGFAMLPDDAEGATPPIQADPLDVTKAYVEEAIRRYREDPEMAKEYYRSRASFGDLPGLYLLVLDGSTIIVNGSFPGAEGSDISWRSDPTGYAYGRDIVAADADGEILNYLIPDPQDEYTFRKKTAWAIHSDDLVFSAGWLDVDEDVESMLTEEQTAIGAVIKARARFQVIGGIPTLEYYRSPESIDGEFYVWLALPTGIISADASMPDLPRGTHVSELQSSDDPELGQKILAVTLFEPRWISHMWPNPATGREELKHSYVTRFFGFYIVSGYYDDMPPPVVTDPCFAEIYGAGTHDGVWDGTCLSENRPVGEGGDTDSDYYARFYTFTLDEAATVAISLTSDEDTFLYLMEGSGKDGRIVDDNDDISSNDRNSRIEDQSLGAGTYTIEATTYDAQAVGDFTLVVEIEAIGEPPEPPVDVKYTAISSGANHVCAIAEDGSIMCWGNDDYGQVSEQPTTGRFTQISSGDNHTCALRDDGAVICWGSIDIP